MNPQINVVNVNLAIPLHLVPGIDDGTLERVGGIVRCATTKRFVSLLDEVDLPISEPTKSLMVRLTSASTSGSKGQAALVVAGVGVVIVGGAFAASYVEKKRAAVRVIAAKDKPECVTNFEASLRAYVHAGRAGALDAAVVDNLIVDLDAVKAFMEEGNEVLISLDNLVPLFDLVIAHTPKFAADGVDFPELVEDDSEGGVTMPLRRHLKAQKTILDEAA